MSQMGPLFIETEQNDRTKSKLLEFPGREARLTVLASVLRSARPTAILE